MNRDNTNNLMAFLLFILALPFAVAWCWHVNQEASADLARNKKYWEEEEAKLFELKQLSAAEQRLAVELRAEVWEARARLSEYGIRDYEEMKEEAILTVARRRNMSAERVSSLITEQTFHFPPRDRSKYWR